MPPRRLGAWTSAESRLAGVGVARPFCGTADGVFEFDRLPKAPTTSPRPSSGTARAYPWAAGLWRCQQGGPRRPGELRSTGGAMLEGLRQTLPGIAAIAERSLSRTMTGSWGSTNPALLAVFCHRCAFSCSLLLAAAVGPAQTPFGRCPCLRTRLQPNHGWNPTGLWENDGPLPTNAWWQISPLVM